MEDYSKYLNIYEGTPALDKKDYRCSVHYHSYRLDKAKEQANMKMVPLETVVNHVNDLLAGLGVRRVEYPVISAEKIDYEEIKKNHKLKSVRDIVWIKFTVDLCGSVR